jgi:hypothetical protein
MSETTTYTTSNRTKYILLAVIVVLAFFAAYGIASGRSSSPATAASPATTAAAPAACDPAAAATSECGGSCCGTGGEAVENSGSAVVEGDVQRISIDVSAGYFDPSIIVVQAGVPVEITFSEGTGCMAEVMFKDFAVFEDLTEGDAVVSLPALEPGEYEFSCGMEMVFGTVVAQ